MRHTESPARKLPTHPEPRWAGDTDPGVYESLLDIGPKKGRCHKLINEYHCIPICFVIFCILVYALGYLTGYVSTHHCGDPDGSENYYL